MGVCSLAECRAWFGPSVLYHGLDDTLLILQDQLLYYLMCEVANLPSEALFILPLVMIHFRLQIQNLKKRSPFDLTCFDILFWLQADKFTHIGNCTALERGVLTFDVFAGKPRISWPARPICRTPQLSINSISYIYLWSDGLYLFMSLLSLGLWIWMNDKRTFTIISSNSLKYGYGWGMSCCWLAVGNIGFTFNHLNVRYFPSLLTTKSMCNPRQDNKNKGTYFFIEIYIELKMYLCTGLIFIWLFHLPRKSKVGDVTQLTALQLISRKTKTTCFTSP